MTPTAVLTPSGRYPLAGTTWIVSNNTMMTESIPAFAIVLAIIFFIFCLLGLLFLLIKERKPTGFMQVSVQGPGLYHMTQVPVSQAGQIVDVEHRVGYIRGLIAALPPPPSGHPTLPPGPAQA
ncbi:MAG: hypothetical protein ABI838_01980 [Chloroflexota bacterium]